MKYIYVSALFLMSVSYTSCGQNQTNSPKDNMKSETKDTVTSRWIYTKYEYTDSIGKRLIIQNSFPRGEKYTDPAGKGYVYAVFWTRIVNETDDPCELIINFPAESSEWPSAPGVYYKLFFPPDTMTIDKEPLYDYGLGVKAFLDNHLSKPSSLKRTISPKASSAFYVVTLSNKGVNGTLRTGFSLKGENLFYTVNGKEIHCGSINLKNLMLQK